MAASVRTRDFIQFAVVGHCWATTTPLLDGSARLLTVTIFSYPLQIVPTPFKQLLVRATAAALRFMLVQKQKTFFVVWNITSRSYPQNLKKAAMSTADLERKVALTNEKVIGNGSFGVVFQATLVETGETVAVKKVLQDKRFKVADAVTVSGDHYSDVSVWTEPRASDHEAVKTHKCLWAEKLFLFEGRQGNFPIESWWSYHILTSVDVLTARWSLSKFSVGIRSRDYLSHSKTLQSYEAASTDIVCQGKVLLV